MKLSRPLWIVVGVAAALLVLVFGAMAWVESEAGRSWVERKASEASGREVSIGEIDIKLGWHPGIRVSGLRIANPDWAKTRHLIDTEYIDARFRILPLLVGRPVIEHLTLVQAKIGAEREEKRNTWTFKQKDDEPQEDKPLPLIVHRIDIDRGQVYFRDTTIDTALEIDVTGGVGGGNAIDVTAQGKVKGQKTRAVAQLPGLLPTPDTPVEMSAAVTIGDITAAFAGIVRADDVDGVDIDIDVSGASLADLKRLAPVNLPETPPYRLQARFRNPADAFIIDGIQGRVGDSDLSGDARYTRSKRPVLQARLTSRLLDLDDLGPAVGAPSKTAPGETAGAKQKQQVQKTKETGKVLPDKGFKVEDWPTMDADVQFEGKRIVDAAQVPIENLSVKWLLKDGVLRFEPLTFTIADGKVHANVSLDGTRKPVAGKANITLTNINLRKLVPATSKVTEPLGTIYGRIDLTGNGTSIAELFGSANGRLAMLINGGYISNLLVELGGLDVAESLRILATRDQQVRLRCAVADLSLKDGVATPQVLIIDTTDTVVDGKGTLNFKTEEIDLVTSPAPKDPSPFVLRSPIVIGGTLGDPKIRPKAGPLAARAGAALLLGAVNPLLAVIPFIETGPGEDTDCGHLMQQVKTSNTKGAGAPPAKPAK
jgi:AsmA family protein